VKLHADLYKWDTTSFVDALPEFDLPRQSEFDRKEALHLQILDLLDRGKAWEIAIGISKELQDQYEHSAFDYKRNAELLSHQATLYDSIASDPRAYSPFFRVGYYGRGFPVSFSLTVLSFEECGVDGANCYGCSVRQLFKISNSLLVDTSGKDWRHFANVCKTSTLARRCSKRTLLPRKRFNFRTGSSCRSRRSPLNRT
jgi:hypothetical protein